MRIKLSNAGKRFNREWIFRNANLELVSGNSYAVTGPNGSGKSTLLQCIGGMFQLSEGKIEMADDRSQMTEANAYHQISFCAPYLDVIEEMTAAEFLSFHQQFKSFIDGFTIKRILEEIDLLHAAEKQIRFYSSGMKQRVKLAQAFFSQADIILLDEPCSNLDAKGIDLYHSLIANYCTGRLVVVCSNDPVEYSFCREVISVMEYKGVHGS